MDEGTSAVPDGLGLLHSAPAFGTETQHPRFGEREEEEFCLKTCPEVAATGKHNPKI
jgi:hypothetical protein